MKQTFTRLLSLLAVAGSALAAYCGPALTITDASMTKLTTASKLYAESDNVIRCVKFNVTLENTGDAEVPAGKTLTVMTRSDEYDLQTWPIPETIAPGESKNFEFGGELSLSTLMGFEGRKSSYWEAICIQEDVTFTTYSNKSILGGSWFDLCPYIVDFCLTPVGSGAELDAAINYGFVTEASTKAFRLRSIGSADVLITAIELPEGFTIDQTLPLALIGRGNPEATDANEYCTVNITLTPLSAGVKAGKIRFVSESLTKEYDISGSCIMPGVFYEGFESDEGSSYVPAGWILGDNWGVANNYQSDDDKYVLAHSSATNGAESFAITPLLHFNAGEAMSVTTIRRSYDSKLEIYYSPDRVNWTVLKRIAGRAQDGYEMYPSNNYTPVELILSDIPEGNYYIGFRGLYTYVNDVFGGSIVDVEHDVMVTSTNATPAATVNKPYAYGITARNLGKKAEPAGSYTVELLVDEEVVAAVEAPEWTAGADMDFEFSHVFHSAGEHVVYARITAGDAVATSLNVAVDVVAESSDAAVLVGTAGNEQGTEGAPFKTWDKNSESQVIYTEAYLAKYGIVPGTKINYIAFDARTNADKRINATVKLWLKKVNESTVDPYAAYDISDEEPLYSQQHELLYVNDNNFREFVRMPIEGGYVYEGGNLLMVTRHQDADGYARVYVCHDPELAENAILKSTDSATSFLTMSYSRDANGTPLAKFGVYIEPASVSGKVTGIDGEPLAGQTVELRSGDVLYTAVTDSEGNYSADVFQPELDYVLTVAKAGYVPFSTELSFAASSSVTVDASLTEFSGERAFTLSLVVSAPEGISLDGRQFTLTPVATLESYPAEECVLAADGTATVNVCGGKHILEMTVDGTMPHSSEINVKGDMEHQLALELKETGLELNAVGEIAIYPNPVVDVVNIAGVEAADITVFNAAGVEVASAKAVKALVVDALAPGSYLVVIVTDGQTVTRRMIKR